MRATVIKGVYNDSIITGGSDRPEKTSEDFARERKANEVTYSQLQREWGCTTADLELAVAHGFPKPVAQRVVGGFWSRRGGHESIYRRDQVARWLEETRRLSAFAPKVSR